MTQSVYCYPGTDVLINHAGIRDPQQLQVYESVYSTLRAMELIQNPIQGSFDMEHLKKIHGYLFQDVYPFAGQIRSETISKDSFTFAPFRFIESSGRELLSKLKQEKFLQGMTPEVFSDRAAYYMAEINVLHPFREGNGRTQREFVRELAANAGYVLDWSVRDKNEVLNASIRSKIDTRDLADIIRSSIVPSGLQKEPIQWIIPTNELTFKEVLKMAKGLPVSKGTIHIDAALLNRPIDQYQIVKQGEKELLTFRLKGEQHMQSITLEKIPHLSHEAKNRWIDQAVSSSQNLFKDRGLEP